VFVTRRRPVDDNTWRCTRFCAELSVVDSITDCMERCRSFSTSILDRATVDTDSLPMLIPSSCRSTCYDFLSTCGSLSGSLATCFRSLSPSAGNRVRLAIDERPASPTRHGLSSLPFPFSTSLESLKSKRFIDPYGTCVQTYCKGGNDEICAVTCRSH
jgi:hypothetical protein